MDALKKLGGLDGLEKKLKTNRKDGIASNPADIQARKETFGKNEVS